MNWGVYQLDVKSAFLNGILQEEIYVEHYEGFVKEREEDNVFLLKKAFYGLKQVLRDWCRKIDDHLMSLGFERSLFESTLYVKHHDNDVLIVSLYVDDLLLIGNDAQMLEQFKQEMMKVFEMTDLELMSFFLGMKIKQAGHEVFICQKKYAKEILKKFKLEECKEVNTPMNQKEKLCKEDGTDKVDEGYFRSLIGCLMYLTATHHDILNDVSILSRFMHCASELHLMAAKRVVRYIKGTSNFGVKFTRNKEFKLVGFFNSDWRGSIDDMRTSTINQALWLRKLLCDLNFEQKVSTTIFVDNQVAIFEIGALRRKVLERGTTGRKVHHFFSSSNPLAFRFRMARKIRNAKEMLDEIATTKSKFNLLEGRPVKNSNTVTAHSGSLGSLGVQSSGAIMLTFGGQLPTHVNVLVLHFSNRNLSLCQDI
ncbi:hypothetical protein GQ457_01G032430 [Hibiscus cannabinus]